jgi:hypothetical protein
MRQGEGEAGGRVKAARRISAAAALVVWAAAVAACTLRSLDQYQCAERDRCSSPIEVFPVADPFDLALALEDRVNELRDQGSVVTLADTSWCAVGSFEDQVLVGCSLASSPPPFRLHYRYEADEPSYYVEQASPDIHKCPPGNTSLDCPVASDQVAVEAAADAARTFLFVRFPDKRPSEIGFEAEAGGFSEAAFEGLTYVACPAPDDACSG